MPNFAYVNKGSGELWMKDYLYLACKATLKMPENATIPVTKVYGDPGKQEDNTVQGNVYRKEYLDLAQRIVYYYDKYGKAPGWAVNTSLGSTMSFHNLVYMFSMILGYWYESGKIPGFAQMTLFSRPPTNPTAPDNDGCYRSKRYLKDANIKQDTNYWCACNIFQQIMYELYGLTISESVIASAMGTTTDGTAHNGIINGGKAIAKQYGHNVTIEFKNYSDMTEKQIGELIADPNVGIFIHDLYKLTWGHYEYLIGLCLSSGVYTVANSLSGGYIEQRSRTTMQSYINGISQPSVGIVRKIS